MRRRWVALLPGILWCAAAVCPASEPEGALALRTAWAGDSSRLLITIDPRVEILDAVLVPRAPVPAALRLVRGDRPGQAGDRLPLGTLRPGRAVVLEFEARRDLPERAVAAFVVEGRTVSGRAVREAVGHVLSAGPPPQIRSGAAEYPARVAPSERR